MPYIKPKEPNFARLGRLFRGYGLSGREIGRILSISGATACKKLDNPELFTLGELRKLNTAAHIPAEEIRECILF